MRKFVRNAVVFALAGSGLSAMAADGDSYIKSLQVTASIPAGNFEVAPDGGWPSSASIAYDKDAQTWDTYSLTLKAVAFQESLVANLSADAVLKNGSTSVPLVVSLEADGESEVILSATEQVIATDSDTADPAEQEVAVVLRISSNGFPTDDGTDSGALVPGDYSGTVSLTFGDAV